MSYDYNALVQQFWSARHKAESQNSQEDKRPYLLQAIEAIETLSGHCPMTPLLWIQYASTLGEIVASDGGSIEYTTLQVGLLEFPGSLLLHLRAAHVAPADDQQACYEKAIKAIGSGSYRNQDHLVVQIYRRLATLTGDANVFLQRSRCPMRQQNETLIGEFRSFAVEKSIVNSEETISSMEDGRKWEAKVLRQLATHEDSVDAAYHAQGLPSIPLDGDYSVDWKGLMDECNLGMGLGGAELASAFIRYAKAVQRVRGEKGTFDPQELSIAVYERSIAECPTSEPLWLAYLSDIRRFRNGIEHMESVTERAVRNCPFSLSLARERVHAMEYLAAACKIVISPDELLGLAKECLGRKFLPLSGARELYISVLQVMKRRVMYLLAHQDHDPAHTKKGKRNQILRYDDEEPLKQPGGKQRQLILDDSIRDEIDDLIDDIRETYEEIVAILESPYDKACILKDQAWSEAIFITPLRKALESENSGDAEQRKMPQTATGLPVHLELWDRALTAHKPPIPDTSRLYVEQYAIHRSVYSPRDVLTRIRNIRFLYRQAFDKLNDAKNADGDYLSSASVLGNLWLSWEKCFGSERSWVKAQHAIWKNGEEGAQKHELEEPDTESKRLKLVENSNETSGANIVATSDTNKPDLAPDNTKAVHAFTVKVLKLSTATTDMDLVDAFRSRCGQIVHARIVRHKDGKSKGWGLVQFEDRDSVVKALELSDVLGIQGKSVVVERSHMPASPLVPAGMHRVVAKGEGKTSRRNETRKQRIKIK